MPNQLALKSAGVPPIGIAIRRIALAAYVLAACLLAASASNAQEADPPKERASDGVAPAAQQDTPPAKVDGTPEATDELSVAQARLADRFKRLEEVIGRLAELSESTDPRRAKLLREAIAKSREQDISVRFESIVELLEGERLSAAATNQKELKQELDDLLTLLLKADRDKELTSQRERVRKYLKEIGRLIRQQKGVRARTEGGDELPELRDDQKRIAKETGKLGGDIAENEVDKKDSDGEKPGKESKDIGKDGDSKPGDLKKTDGQLGDNQSDNSEEGSKESDGKSEESGDDSKSGDESKSDQSKSGESKPDQSSKSQKGQQQQGEQSPSEPRDESSKGGKPSDGIPSDSKNSGQPGSPSENSGKSGDDSEQPQQQPEQPQDPADRASKRLQDAQQKMEDAQEKLKDAEREGAVEQQREALKDLEQAKAELERILRQLREEELERTLTQLAARFRKMLEQQNIVYEGTIRLDRIDKAERGHDQEIEAAKLSRQESQIVSEADRALLLLREDGSSVAFPEALEQMRGDMRQIAERLGAVKVDAITQGLEEDVIAALEEIIATLEKAIKDLENKKTPPGQPRPAGEPTEPPLVEDIAELKMIRSLQMRINMRTQRYGKMIEGEQAETDELIEALKDLAERQRRVYRATADLQQGRND